MCGIAGIVGPKPFLSEGMQRMLYALRHRGPDGEGIEADAHAIFGHRRLSIIDLSRGHQPLHDADGKIWLVCNGEIYNYEELRRDLVARGHQFLTNGDCEVILHLYVLYGERCLEHLRGMFAFALWDSEKQLLFAARDHLGQKPFFYARTERLLRVRLRDQGDCSPSTRRCAHWVCEALDQYFAPAAHGGAAAACSSACTSCRPGTHCSCSGEKSRGDRRYWKCATSRNYRAARMS